MSKVTDLDDVRRIESLEKEVVSLRRENRAAMLTIQKLMKDVSDKQQEIEHLKKLLTQTAPVIAPKKDDKIIRIEVSAEEEIMTMQLERLRKAAQERTLTLDETRMYDILVKNKRLSQDQSTINLNKDDYKTLSTKDLLQIAATKPEEE